MGIPPAPKLANDFAFWHEYGFFFHMVQDHKQYGACRYSFDFLPNMLFVLSVMLMTSSLCPFSIRMDLRYMTLFHKMVSSMICNPLRYVSSMILHGLPLLFGSFANN